MELRIEPVRIFVERGYLGRWILVRANDPSRAWSGSRWVVHYEGIPALVPVSTFGSAVEAAACARESGFEIVAVKGNVL